VAIPAVPAAVILLKRRRIGSIIVMVGILVVVIGFLLPLTSVPTPTGAPSVTLPDGVVFYIPGHTSLELPLPAGGDTTGLALLRHVTAPLLTGNIGATVVDIATRAGIALMALAAALALVLNAIPGGRGFVGMVAGLGLFGTAVEMGVLLGEQMRTLSLSPCSGSACSVDPHAGIWLCAIGFGLALAGGAIGALRPLAGLVSGISFTLVGVAAASGLAYLVAAQHVLDVVGGAISS